MSAQKGRKSHKIPGKVRGLPQRNTALHWELKPKLGEEHNPMKGNLDWRIQNSSKMRRTSTQRRAQHMEFSSGEKGTNIGT